MTYHLRHKMRRKRPGVHHQQTPLTNANCGRQSQLSSSSSSNASCQYMPSAVARTRTTMALCVLSSLALASAFTPPGISSRQAIATHPISGGTTRQRIRDTLPPTRTTSLSISPGRPSRHVRNVLSEPESIATSSSDRSGGSSSSSSSSSSASSSSTSLEAKSPRVKGSPPSESTASSSQRRRPRKKIKVQRRQTESEKRATQVRKVREAKYREVREKAVREEGRAAPSVWSFESLFPDTVWDDESVYQDLYTNNKAGGKTFLDELAKGSGEDGDNSNDGGVLSSPVTPGAAPVSSSTKKNGSKSNRRKPGSAVSNQIQKVQNVGNTAKLQADSIAGGTNSTSTPVDGKQVNKVMTRMVEDKVYGFRRSPAGDFEYDTSLMGDGAVQFRDGRRLGNALKVNADRLNYHAKCEFRHGRLEEARELYEQAIEMDPRDGRAYLGLSRIAQRRRDFAYAKKCLRAGISNSFSRQERSDGAIIGDNGANPFLLQALGCLEERVGNLAEAEALYVEAAKSRPSHAAAWVSLAQLRTRKFRQGARAGRVCYQTAELELQRAGLPASSFVYTAWAAMEYKKASDVRRARELFEKALEVDPKCSAAWLQLGVMEADKENWERAQECFESALKNDQRNARILQAYAIMETKRPDGSSRTAIELFERALKVKPRDAGVLQAYALYVAKLGDTDTARDLLHRGTTVNKRHAPVWQAWGVLETRYGNADDARDIFQQGIWACAQSGGGQSGGRRCARLWQAWGVLEAREGDYAAARRCFGRALDADNFNVAAVTAWTQMEEELGNIRDARMIFERALKQFTTLSDDKIALYRSYELMEQRAGNVKASQNVYQRSIRESMSTGTVSDVILPDEPNLVVQPKLDPPPDLKTVLKKSTPANEVEVVRWRSASDSMNGEVWLTREGSIEGRVPSSVMKKKRQQQQQQQQQQMDDEE